MLYSSYASRQTNRKIDILRIQTTSHPSRGQSSMQHCRNNRQIGAFDLSKCCKLPAASTILFRHSLLVWTGLELRRHTHVELITALHLTTYRFARLGSVHRLLYLWAKRAENAADLAFPRRRLLSTRTFITLVRFSIAKFRRHGREPTETY